MERNILEIKDLSIRFPAAARPAANGLSLSLREGETLGIVGESGAGKSIAALSVMRLLPPRAQVSGSILYAPSGKESVDLLALPEAQLRRYRGKEIAMVFQAPMSSLNPVYTCGEQIAEAVRQAQADQDVRKRVMELLDKVQISDPQRIYRAYPHELSGGQKQRVMIAIAIACSPRILIADEPTTALDPTIQRAILDLLRRLQSEMGMSMIFISHDMGVIAEVSDRVAVLKRGEILECGQTSDILQTPQQPYTKGLLACRLTPQRRYERLPTIQDFYDNPSFQAVETPAATLEMRRALLYEQEPVLSARDISVRFPAQKNALGLPTAWLDAVDKVSFDLYPGETLGLIGESGSGKTTLAKSLIPAFDIPYTGRVSLQSETPEGGLPIAYIHQDPYASLNPLIRVGEAVIEPLLYRRIAANRKEARNMALELFRQTGLDADLFERLPAQLSGGQRQRVCIARALAVKPRILICDEIASALDVSVQALIFNLLLDLNEKLGLSYLLISHDLSVVRQMCDRVLVMCEGRAVESGRPEALLERPQHPYTQRLVAAQLK